MQAIIVATISGLLTGVVAGAPGRGLPAAATLARIIRDAVAPLVVVIATVATDDTGLVAPATGRGLLAAAPFTGLGAVCGFTDAVGPLRRAVFRPAFPGPHIHTAAIG